MFLEVTVVTGVVSLVKIVSQSMCLTLFHSEGPNSIQSFGPYECSRVRHINLQYTFCGFEIFINSSIYGIKTRICDTLSVGLKSLLIPLFMVRKVP